MEDVMGSKSVMHQSLFGEEEQSTENRLVQAVEAAELRWRKTAQAAAMLGGLGVVLALIAMAVALVR